MEGLEKGYPLAHGKRPVCAWNLARQQQKDQRSEKSMGHTWLDIGKLMLVFSNNSTLRLENRSSLTARWLPTERPRKYTAEDVCLATRRPHSGARETYTIF